MSDDRELPAEAVNLLLELLELPSPILSAAAAQLYLGTIEPLIDGGFLVPHDVEEVTTSLANDDDAPVALAWSERSGGMSYFSPVAGPILVSHAATQRWRVNVGRVLAVMAKELDLPRRQPPFEIIPGLLWEIPDARIGARAKRSPIWFARRLWDGTVHRGLTEAARARPIVARRVVLTSASPARLSGLGITGALIVSVQDVMQSPGRLLISQDILDARLRGVLAYPSAAPLELSPDGTWLRIAGGPEIAFRSQGQIAIIRRLVDGYPRGERHRGAELLKLAGSDVGSLQRLFGTKKWRELSPYLNQVNSRWGFEL